MKRKYLAGLLAFLFVSGCSLLTFQAAENGQNLSGNPTNSLSELPTVGIGEAHVEPVNEIYYLQSGACVVNAVNPVTSEIRTLTTTPPPFDCWRPQFSPDGNQLAFVSMDGNYDLYVMNLDGSNLTRLAQAIAFAWSPDGTQLVYQTYNVENDRGQLWLVDVQNAESRNLDFRDASVCTSCSGDLTIAWSPAADWIYSPVDLDYPNTYTVTAAVFNVSTGEVKQIYANELPFWSPAAWSADGKTLAVVVPGTDDYGCMDLFLSKPTGEQSIFSGEEAYKAGEAGISASCFSSTSLAWSPDSASVLLSGTPGGLFTEGEVQYARILQVNILDETVKLLEYWDGHPGAFIWSPDQNQFAFISTPTFSDPEGMDGPLYIMTNDAENPQYAMLVEKVKNSPLALYWMIQ